jgi:hypothetical protein
MNYSDLLFSSCSHHGKPTKRQSCRECNAAYMRNYLRQRRRLRPDYSIWDRARKRAKGRNIKFSIVKGSISIPRTCPVLGMKIEYRGQRSECSPSLDRIVPALGYVTENIRVISDRANRLKGNRNSDQLRRLANSGPVALREDYRMIVTYLEREQLLDEVRLKALQGGRAGEEWAKIASFLDRIFQKSLINKGGFSEK